MIWKRRKSGPEQDELWQQAFDTTGTFSRERKQQLLQSIHQRMNAAGNRRRKIMYISAGAAAAVLSAFIVRFTLTGNKLVPVTQWNMVASNEERKKIELADGSVIWLAPYTTVKLYPAFTSHRNVVLEEGTAFFEVAQDKEHPFAVTANRQQVQVLGTRFTISMKDTVDLNLVVKDGKVALSNQSGRLIVNGGEQVSTLKAAAGAVAPVPEALADWWLQHEVRFMDITLNELLDNVEAYYHVKLDRKNVRRNTRVTLTWSFSQTLEENLAVLNLLTGYNIH